MCAKKWKQLKFTKFISFQNLDFWKHNNFRSTNNPEYFFTTFSTKRKKQL